MAIKITNIQVKRANAATWTSLNPILLDGEIGFERDTNQIKVGNGSDNWNTLIYIGTGSFLQEQVEDIVGALITNGPGITTTYNDAGDSLTISISDEIYTTIEKNKLAGIESGATADQTGSEIEASLDTELANTRWKEQEVPSGGTTGQVLKKNTNTNYDYSWQDDETGAGGGAVDSVNSQTGVVVLDADDISDASTTNKFVTSADITKLGNLSGTNTGDENTASIQSKRPLKTVNSQSLEGAGNIVISGGASNPNVFIPTDENDLSDAGNAGKIALVQTTITLTEDLNIAENIILKDDGGLIDWNGFDIIGDNTQVIFAGDKQFFDIGVKDDAFQGTWIAPEVVSFTNFGAIADLKELSDGAITAADNTFTSASANFTSADIGKHIQIQEAGTPPDGIDLGTPTLITTIASVTNSTTIELTDPAVNTVSGVKFKFGTDNYERGLAAINLRNFNSGTLRIPYDNRYTKGGRFGTRIVDEEPLLANRPTGWVIGDGMDYIKVNGGGSIESLAHNEAISRFIYFYKTNFSGIEDLRVYGEKDYHVNSGEVLGTDEFNFGINWASGSNWLYAKNLLVADFHGDAMVGNGDRQQENYIKGANINPVGIDSTLTVGNIDAAGTIDTGQTDFIYSTSQLPLTGTIFTNNKTNDPLGYGWVTLSEIAISGWGGLTTPYCWFVWYDSGGTFIEKSPRVRIYDRIPLLNEDYAFCRVVFERVKDKEDINLQVNPTVYPQGLYLENVHLDNCLRQGFSNPPSNTYWNGGRITNIGEALPSYGIDVEDVRWETKGIVFNNIEFENCFGGGIKLVGTEDVKIINCTFKKTNAIWEGSQTYYALSVDYGRDVVMQGNIIYHGSINLGRYNHFLGNQCYDGILGYSAEGVVIENNLFHNYKRQSLEAAGKDFEKGIMRNNTWTYDRAWTSTLFRDFTNKMDIIGDKYLFNRVSRITPLNDATDKFLELNSTTGTIWQISNVVTDYGGIIKDMEFSGAEVELSAKDINDGGMTPNLQDHENVYYGTSIRFQRGLPRDYTFKNLRVKGWIEFDCDQFENTIVSATPTIYMLGGETVIKAGEYNWTNTGSMLLDTPVKNVSFYIKDFLFDLQVASTVTGSSNRFMDLNHLGTTVFDKCTFKSATAKTIDFTNINIFPAGLGKVTIIDPVTSGITFTLRAIDELIYTGKIIFNNQSGTSYNSVVTDRNRVTRMTNGSANTFTVMAGLYSTGDVIKVKQSGAGVTTLAPDTGVTLNGTLIAPAQYLTATCYHIGSNVWEVTWS